jgi:hypothetical protein
MPLPSQLSVLERDAAGARALLPALWVALVALNLGLQRAGELTARAGAAGEAEACEPRPRTRHRWHGSPLRRALTCSLGLGLPALAAAAALAERGPYLLLAGGVVVYELATATLRLSLLLQLRLFAALRRRTTAPRFAPVAGAISIGGQLWGRRLLTLSFITLCGLGMTGSPTLLGGSLLLAAAGGWALAPWRRHGPAMGQAEPPTAPATHHD